MWGVLGLGLAAALVVAAVLEPDPHGRGTHQQLGLPPCTFVLWFGLPCPTCGMTTAWAYMARGQVPAAWEANAGGAALFVAAVVGAVWLLVSSLWGRPLTALPPARIWQLGCVSLAVLVLWDWVRRLSAAG